MSNSDDEYWSINGISLNQYCWAVATKGGTPRSLPTLRGTNIGVGYIPGQVWRPKFADSRVITLTMWVNGVDPATDNPNSSDTKRQFNDNLRFLQRVFYNPPGGQVPLTRKWYYTSPTSIGIPVGAPTMVSATAMVEVGGPMVPTMTGPTRADFAIDFLLADPYFYGDSQTWNFSIGSPLTVYNPGDDAACYKSGSSVTLHGPLYYPRLTNSSTTIPTWFQLNTIIMAGDSVTFDLCNLLANRASDGINLTGTVTHSGNRRWMLLDPGNNVLTLTSSANTDTGNGSITYSPAYV